jgi:hypothetical protein
MESDQRPGLGRRFAPDPRDRRFAMRAIAPKSKRQYRYWNDRQWRGNQGMTSMCVAFAWLHWLHTGPVTQRVKGSPMPCVDPLTYYRRAQDDDEWAGPPPPYDGTSVRAGAKVAQADGYISSYHWADTVEDVVNGALEVGPVVIGSIWTEQMFSPNSKGYIRADGPVVGGHAWTITGVSRPKREFTALNSWGEDWGLRGRFKITFEEMEKLRAQEWEACLAVEVKK